MTQIINPSFAGPATPPSETAPVASGILPPAEATGAINPVAKEPEANADWLRCGSVARVRVGEASAVLPTTSEFMDVTGRRDAHSISQLVLSRANARTVLSGADPVGPGRKTGSDLANVPAVETLANMGVTAGETAPDSNPDSSVPSVRSTAAALENSAPLFSSVRVRDAEISAPFMRG